MNKELLAQMVHEKKVVVQKHPTEELYLYNYATRVQYERLWNEVTLQARGLILDAQMNIVAKPFGKFFNIEEHHPDEIPQLPFEVFEKLDGSLGILYWVGNTPFIATRGSFESEQARHATEILHTRYSHTFEKLNPAKTYLFEIIYPQNKIVVDYGTMDDLVLLTVIDTRSGEEQIEDVGFPLVKSFDGINNLQQLKAQQEENKEGFVVRFQNGFRVKVKFAEYLRLHKIITGVSNRDIWEYLQAGKEFDELLARVPDEWYQWLTQTRNELEQQYQQVYNNALEVYRELYHADKKTFASRVFSSKAKDISGVVFNLYDGKKVEPLIWKMLRPASVQSFKKDEQ